MIRGLFVAAALATTAFAQNDPTPATRAEEIENQRAVMSRTPLPPDTDPLERAITWSYNHELLQLFTSGWHGIAPTTGGLVDKAGIPFGVQYLRSDLLGGDMIVRASARASVREYYMLDFETGLPRLAGDTLFVDVYARHRYMPQLDYYGSGMRSEKSGRSNYLLEDTQADLTAGFHPFRPLRLAAVGGYYAPNVGVGTNDAVAKTQKLYSPIDTPGLDRQTDYYRGGGLLHVDFRDSPYGPRSGGQYYGRFDYFYDRQKLGYSFRRLTAEAQQYIPMFNNKRVLVLRARSLMSFTRPGEIVPFYLQPSLGGSWDLRGYRPFRFYDNNSIVYNAEWRWEVMTSLDAALFADAGKVAPRPGLLNFKNMQESYGAGLRFRAPVTGAVIMRWDFAVSREGFQFVLAFGDMFATPYVRTGRELSPPVGRLP